jgi:hypothetical protein
MYVDHDKPWFCVGGIKGRQSNPSPSKYLTPAGAFLSFVFSTGTYAPSAALTAPATTNLFVAVVILALFVLSAVLSIARKDITQGFDEAAHVSYVAGEHPAHR